MKTALIITNRVRKIPGGLVECAIKPLQELGYKVFWAADFSIAKFDLKSAPCEIIKTSSRSNPLNFKNIKTYFILKKVIREKQINIVFCHTPIGGFLGRLVASRLKVNVVIYQAHGFLFFEKGPKLGWLYKIVERWLAKKTDFLITINNEDYSNACKFKLKKGGKCFLVHGSGMKLDFSQDSYLDKEKIKKELGIEQFKKIIISIGELNANKNVETLIKSLPFIKSDNFVVLICGEGTHQKKLERLVDKLKLKDKVRMLGYRTDIPNLLKVSDLYVTCSKREGLSRTISESMAAGLPCVVSNRRGMKDLIDNELGGFLFEPKNYKELALKISLILNMNVSDLDSIKFHNQEKIKLFQTEVVRKECLDILSIADERISH